MPRIDMFLLPVQLALVMCTFLSGIPISRKLFPDKDDSFWCIFGFALSSVYFAVIVIIGILIHNVLMHWLTIISTILWIASGFITGRNYRPAESFKRVTICYLSLLLLAIAYQWIIYLKFHFPQSGAIGYPIDNYIPFWVNDILYHLKNPDHFHLYPEWHLSDRPILFSLVETFFFHLFTVVPFSSLPGYPEYIHPLLFYFFLGPILNSLVLIPTFWLLKLMFNERTAIFGTAIFALAPFTIINAYFSWPKYFATFFFLSAIYFAMRDEKVHWIALFAALAFLSHAMYIFFLPGLIIYYALRKNSRHWREMAFSSMKLLLLFAIFIMPWIFWVYFIYDSPSDKFLRYPFAIYWNDSKIMANTSSVLKTFTSTPVQTIIWVRVVNAVQSLFPVSLGLAQEGYPTNVLNIYSNILRYYWTTIPGTLFITTFILSYYSIAKNYRANRTFCFSFLVLPFLLHLLFWGFAFNNGHGGEMGRNDAHLFGPILAGLVAAEALKLSKRLLRLLLAFISMESIVIMYLNFDLLYKYRRPSGTFTYQNLILLMALLGHVLVMRLLIRKCP